MSEEYPKTETFAQYPSKSPTSPCHYSCCSLRTEPTLFLVLSFRFTSLHHPQDVLLLRVLLPLLQVCQYLLPGLQVLQPLLQLLLQPLLQLLLQSLLQLLLQPLQLPELLHPLLLPILL